MSSAYGPHNAPLLAALCCSWPPPQNAAVPPAIADFRCSRKISERRTHTMLDFVAIQRPTLDHLQGSILYANPISKETIKNGYTEQK